MPELPEVETIKRIIEPQIKDRIILDASVEPPSVLSHPSLEVFCHSVKNRTITGIGRRGKFLQIFLDDGLSIILHLRMTGQLICVPGDYPEKPHTHAVLRLSGETNLRYIDVRRLGHIWLIRKNEKDIFSGIEKLGTEPFDETFNGKYLRNCLGNRRITIKQGLLDQSVIAGIGNIYSDEILFAAGIHPACPVSEINEESWHALALKVTTLLEQAIRDNAITAEEYLSGEGKEYRNTPFFLVYGNEGKACPKCGHQIERIKISGRSSCFCPCCQPLERVKR